jgi:dienelactone hydrolase
MLIGSGMANAAVKAKVVNYKQGDTALEGYLAWDDALQGRRPGVLVVHEWTGLGDYARTRARKLAEMGYVAFAADIYGTGIRPKTPPEAAAQSGIYKTDRPLMRVRAQAGLDVLRHDPMCDPQRIAAIGYCFGGTCVLELARSGADIAGVVSFHGGLDTPTPADAKNIKCKVLVLHGGDDPHVPAKDVDAFETEMRAGGVDWQLVVYGGAVHGFTKPASGNDKSRGAAYNARADSRSWQAMRAFFAEILNAGQKGQNAATKGLGFACCQEKGEPLVESGLLGPVTLRAVERLDAAAP